MKKCLNSSGQYQRYAEYGNLMTIIKICGLSTPEHALAAATAGADWIGLVFAPSRRQVTVDQAATIVATLRRASVGQHVRVVGLFVHTQPAQINMIADACGLDYVQLSGDETPAEAFEIARPVLKAVRPETNPTVAEWLTLFRGQPRMSDGSASAISPALCFPGLNRRFLALVDAHVPGVYGGTGVQADWDQAAKLARDYPLMLAGGLTPENVAEAIRRVRPWGVDVSSGVETDGVKDATRIAAFIRAVRRASLHLATDCYNEGNHKDVL